MAMAGPQVRYLPDETGESGRLHLQHGPIDLIIGVDGLQAVRALCFEQATIRFETILEELVSELMVLRSPASPGMQPPKGKTAGRMVEAVSLFAAERFITPMAAVAGAVADEILAAMLQTLPRHQYPSRAYVNNGGDIALHLNDDAEFRVKISREDSAALGYFTVDAASSSRGIATSGRGGRSLSMGIADSVTVVARNAAIADAAATLIANAVDLPGHPSIERVPARELADDSDLGERLAVRSCGPLSGPEIDEALARGRAEADRLIALGLVEKAALFLKDQGRLATGQQTQLETPAVRAGGLPIQGVTR